MTKSNRAVERPVSAEERLQQVPFFQGAKPAMLHDLAEHLKPRRYRSGSDVFHRGDPGNAMFIITSGAVRIYLPSERDVVLAVLREGDMFGEMALLERDIPGRPNGSARSASARAIQDSVLLRLERADFERVLDHYPEAQRAVIDVLVERLRKTNESIQDAYLLEVPGRLARRILLIAEEHGRDAEAGRELGIRVSQQDLADMIGASRVAVNKQLQVWRRDGIIEISRQRITILDIDALKKEYPLLP